MIQFVDSIDANPTVRLDLNDGLSWFCTRFSAPPPRLRRSESENSMRDGGVVASSTYGNRTLELDLTLIEEGDEEWAADEMQKLWRELDRPTNVIRYWPDGLDAPVFFRTFRSDVSELEELWTTPIARNISLEVLAEPFALGLKETLGPFTVYSDPVAVSNPGYVDLPAILGDVPADIVYWDSASTTRPNRVIAVRWSDTPSGVVSVLQAESGTPGNSTANPGGGPDAAMSGTGTNNYLTTDFSGTATMLSRVSWTQIQPAGRYRVLVACRRSGTSSVIEAQTNISTTVDGPVVTIPASASTRLLVDLGVVEWPEASAVGQSSVVGISSTAAAGAFRICASRTGGTDTIDWDCVYLIPAGGQNDSIGGTLALVNYAQFNTANVVLDGENGRAFNASAATDPTTTSVAQYPSAVAGGFPRVTPAATNRLYALATATNDALPVTSSVSASVSYWPRYLFVRPVSS